MERAIFERMEAIDSDHWWFRGRRAIVATLIARLAKGRRSRILEIGCGTGSNLAMLAQFGTVEAIEPDETARAIASARSGIAVAPGMLPDGIDVADGAYDLIVLLDVLEHVADDAATLRTLRRKLAPGGTLLITVPSAPWMWSAHDIAHHHHRRYGWPALAAALHDAGYAVAHHSHFNTLLYPVVALARIAARITGKRGGDDAMPPRAINTLLAWLFAAEARWVARRTVPIGVSLAVVARAG